VKDKVAIKLIAAKGKVQVQAQGGEMELTAEQDLNVTSLRGNQLLNGKQEVLLTCGGAYIRIKDGAIELHAPGTVSFKGAKHVFGGGDSLSPTSPAFPESAPKFPLSIQFDRNPLGAKTGWKGMPYSLYADGALKETGVLDKSGQLLIKDHSTLIQKYTLVLANGVEYQIPVSVDFSNAAEGQPANQGFHKELKGTAPDASQTEAPETGRQHHYSLFQPTTKGH
jgi:type VI secretion system secreted protein VgrG